MIDLATETIVSMSEGAQVVPGGGVNTSTMWRWSLKGVRGVILETIIVGGRRKTSHEALERFIAATSATAAGASSTPAAVSRQRQQAMQRADDILARAGI